MTVCQESSVALISPPRHWKRLVVYYLTRQPSCLQLSSLQERCTCITRDNVGTLDAHTATTMISLHTLRGGTPRNTKRPFGMNCSAPQATFPVIGIAMRRQGAETLSTTCSATGTRPTKRFPSLQVGSTFQNSLQFSSLLLRDRRQPA